MKIQKILEKEGFKNTGGEGTTTGSKWTYERDNEIITYVITIQKEINEG